MMQTIQTTLAQGAPWPVYAPNSSRIGTHYKVRKDKGTHRPLKKDFEDVLRQHISSNPGQSMTEICINLKWERKKVQRYMTAIRSEVGNGHFLLKDLKP